MINRTIISLSLFMGLFIVGLMGCSAPGEQEGSASNPPGEPATTATAPAGATRTPPTPVPTSDIAGMFQPTGSPAVNLSEGVSGIGSVEAEKEAGLVFTVQGTVQHVYVEDGNVVTDGQVLAILDVRTFDHQVNQAESGLVMAQAQKDQLSESPRAADLRASNAQIRQAQASLNRLLEPPEEIDVRAAEASLALAQTNLQATRDQLSHAKTQAGYQVSQAAYQLTQAQWNYALAQRYWEHADDENTDPVVPVTRNPMTGSPQENFISEGQESQYRVQYEQAKSAMEQAEAAVQQAVVAAEGARRSEVTGVQAAEQQVVQAQIALERVHEPANENDVAAAQAGVDAAVAGRDRLYPDPTDSQLLIADAQVAQAQSALELARLNREYAELRAPFEGVIFEVNIDPGDPAMSGGGAAIKIVDLSQMHVSVDISDVDISSVRLDQSARVYADALAGQVFTGKVSYIAPMADVSGNVRTYEVKIKLDKMQGLRPGMSVRVEIETEAP